MAVNIGGDRYGADRTVGYKKPTGADPKTAAQRYNQSKSSRYPLNNYEADFRFRNSGAFGLGKKKTGSFNIPLGGWGGRGGQRGSHFAELDFQDQKDLDKLVWERSTPDVTGVGATVRWDRDKNMVTSALSPENQAIYDSMYERQKRFGADVDAYSGDWRDIQQERFDQKRALYAESDARAQQERLAREQAIGASSTGMFLGAQTEQALLNQRNRELEEAAFAESQGLIDSSLSRQSNDIASMMNIGNIANQMVKMPQPYPVGNMQGMGEASTAWRDLQALEAAKKKKKIVCTAMNDDYGFGAYRNAIWLRYSELNYKDKPEMEKGYHAIFKPLLKIRKKWYGKPIYALLKHIAKHRSVDLRAEMYNKKRDRIGQAWRFVLEPLCYLVGKRLVNK
jgi:hypothetical protein